MTLTVGSLFSGIGGLDLGLERAGMKVIWQSEIDPYCCKVLRKHWPEVPNHGNIKEIDWQTIERPDVICGGYPCQPFSMAGKRQGENDPRHLWPWVREAVSALRPQYAILENVPGHRTLGGLTVIAELAQIGYDAEWRIVSAAGMGAPHLRKRLIIVAYPTVVASNGRKFANCQSSSKCWQGLQEQTRGSCSHVAYSNSKQLGLDGSQKNTATQRGIWDYHRIRQTRHDFRQWWETEPNVGRVANGIPHRVDRLRGLGNAVVPQVAEYIGRLITQLN